MPVGDCIPHSRKLGGQWPCVYIYIYNPRALTIYHITPSKYTIYDLLWYNHKVTAHRLFLCEVKCVQVKIWLWRYFCLFFYFFQYLFSTAVNFALVKSHVNYYTNLNNLYSQILVSVKSLLLYYLLFSFSLVFLSI